MKTLRLKYRLEPIEENLYEFEVLEMDESFRNESYDSKQNSVKSEAYPNIYFADSSCDIFLRGRVEKLDNHVSTLKLNPKQVEQIHQVLKEWSINWFHKTDDKK